MLKVSAFDIERIYFMDESGSDLHTQKNHGYSKKGIRLFATRYSGQGKRVSNIQTIGYNGIAAKYIFEGTLNKDIYLDYVKNYLIPKLKSDYSIVVMDNLAVHKNKEALQLFADANIDIVFQPPYSPEFNPIENIFSKQKNEIKKISRNSVDDCKNAWKVSTEKITLMDIQNSIQHAVKQWKLFSSNL